MVKNKSVGQVIGMYFQVIFIFLIVFVILYFFLGQLYEVIGDSMYPNFYDKEQLIAEKLSAQFGNLERGDVVIFERPGNENKLLIKRIIGMPDEKILIQDGYVYINGEYLQEPYVQEDTLTEGMRIIESGFEYTIPTDSYMVMGDNREKSTDSREWGFVKSENIIGRAILVYYPLKNIRFVNGVEY
jgi:signal peptidase I